MFLSTDRTTSEKSVGFFVGGVETFGWGLKGAISMFLDFVAVFKLLGNEGARTIGKKVLGRLNSSHCSGNSVPSSGYRLQKASLNHPN